MCRAPRPSCLTASRAGRAAYFQPGERCGPTATPVALWATAPAFLSHRRPAAGGLPPLGCQNVCGGWGGGGRSIPGLSPRGLSLGLTPLPSPAKHDFSAYGGQAGTAGRMRSSVCGGWGLRRWAVGSLVAPRWCSLADYPIVPGQTRQKASLAPAVKTRCQGSVGGAKASGPAGSARPPRAMRALFSWLERPEPTRCGAKSSP